MAHFKSLFLLTLLFAAVILISSKASARKEPDVAKTEGGTQADWQGGGGGGGWNGGGGGYGGGYGHGGYGGGYGHGGYGHGGYGGGYGHGGYGHGGWCHHSHCGEAAGGDETHQAQTETNSGDKHVPLKP